MVGVVQAGSHLSVRSVDCQHQEKVTAGAAQLVGHDTCVYHIAWLCAHESSHPEQTLNVVARCDSLAEAQGKTELARSS